MFRIGVIKYVLAAAFAAVMFTGSASAAGKKPFFEKGIERWGSDFSVFEVTGGPDACYQACVKDKQCLAWSYHRPGTKGKTGECHLKSKVPHPSSNVCCISGVMVGPGAMNTGATAYVPNTQSKKSTAVHAAKKTNRTLAGRITNKFFRPAALDEGAVLGLPELKPAAAAPPIKITPMSFVSSETL